MFYASDNAVGATAFSTSARCAIADTRIAAMNVAGRLARSSGGLQIVVTARVSKRG